MANQQNSYTVSQGTGTGNRDFSYTFPSFTEGEVKVEIDNVVKTLTTHYTVVNHNTSSGGTVRFNSTGLPNGTAGTTPVRIFRQTDVESPKAEFTAGASLKAQEINDNFKQLRHALQEGIGAATTDRKVQRFNIEADSIDGTLIADDVVDSEHLVAGSIDLEHMSANSVDSDQYVDGSVDLIHMSANSVDSDQYVDGSIDLIHMSANSVDSDQYVDGSIDLVHMSANSVDSDHYVDGSIDLIHMSANSVDSDQYVDGSIDHVHLSNDCVDEDNIQDDAVRSEHIQANAVTDSEIATGTLDNRYYTETELDGGSLDTRYYTETELNNGAVDGRYYTETELNAGQLDNRYYTETELNAGQLDNRYFTETESDNRYFRQDSSETIASGVTWNSTDALVATTAAIDLRIIELVDNVGGFVPITNQNSFPTENPDINNPATGGTIVSVQAATTALTAQSGTTLTLPNGRGTGNAVIITGVSATIPSGYGFLVETTSTDHTYAFHRLVPKATEVATVAANAVNISAAGANVVDINNFADLYQISNSAPTQRADSSSLQIGDLWYDSSSNKVLMIYDGSSGDGFTAATPNASDLVNINIVAGQLVYQEDLGLITNAVSTGTGNNSINTVAGSISNVNTVAGSISNVNAVAGNATNINNVANDATDIGAVAGKATEIGRLGTADAVADLAILGTTDIVSDMNTLATSANVTAMDNCSDDIANINTVSGSIGNVNTTAGSITNVNTTAGSIANVNTTAGSIANVNTVAGAISNVNTTAGSITNVNTVATNITDVNTFANRYRIASSNPSTSLDVGDLYFNTSLNELRVYNGSAWQGGVTASGSLAGLTANTFTDTQTIAKTGVDQLIVKDSDSTGNAAAMRISFRDSGNTEKFFVGSNESSNSYFYLGTPSGQNNPVSIRVNGSDRVQATSSGLTVNGSLTASSGLANGMVATTQSASDNSTKVATTAYTDTAIANLVDSSPAALNTLNELAAAINDDANFSTTMTNSIATKAPLASPTFTGTVTVPTLAPTVITTTNLTLDFGSIA